MTIFGRLFSIMRFSNNAAQRKQMDESRARVAQRADDADAMVHQKAADNLYEGDFLQRWLRDAKAGGACDGVA